MITPGPYINFWDLSEIALSEYSLFASLHLMLIYSTSATYYSLSANFCTK